MSETHFSRTITVKSERKTALEGLRKSSDGCSEKSNTFLDDSSSPDT